MPSIHDILTQRPEAGFFWESAPESTALVANGGYAGNTCSPASYDGGKLTRTNKDYMPPHRSGDAAIMDSWQVMTPRMRDLVRNSPTVIAAQRELVKHIIGTGIITMADVVIGMEEGGLPLYEEEFNFQSDDLFDQWADDEADVEGHKSWHDMQWQMFAETVGVGETLLLECMDNTPGRTSPLCYQVLEPEQLDQSVDRPASEGQNRVVRGIELDRHNRAVAYWIYDAHPFDQWSGWSAKSTRIPAERVIHQFMPVRPSMTRGVSWLAAIMQPSRDVDWYLGNELTAAAIGAMLTLIIKRANANGGLGIEDNTAATDEFGNELVKMTRGQSAVIGKDDSIEIAESNRPNRDAGAFIKLMMEQAGMAAGVSYIRLTSDLKATSYTAARAAHLHDAAFFRPVQNWVARESVMPVRRRHTAVAVAQGLLPSLSASQFERQRKRWSRLIAQGPGREQLDPEKETDSAVGRMRAGLSSLPEENALLGRNWRRTLQQQARALGYAKKLADSIGMPLREFLDFSKGGGVANGHEDDQRADDGGSESDSDSGRVNQYT